MFGTSILVCLASLSSISSANAASLNIDSSGLLLGASGVDVGGIHYDVLFRGIDCADAFGACEQQFFPFQTEVEATTAYNALLDQVLSNNVFDTDPSRIRGCENTPGECIVYTPLKFIGDNLQVVFLNNGPGIGGFVGLFEAAPGFGEATELPDITLATWSPTVVPIPAAAWLFGSALFGFIGLNRRKAKTGQR